MATPPTFVASYGNAAWAHSQTASVTVQAGDMVMVCAGTGSSSDTVATPTGGGLTYTLQQSVVGVTQQSNTYVWTATSPTTQTFTLTLTGGESATIFSYFAEVWRSHGGVGSSAKKTATSTTSLTFTTQGANSALVVVNVDWKHIDGTTRTWLTSVGALAEKAYQRNTAEATFYGGHHADSGAVGSKTVGMSAPTGQRPTLIALEVLAAPVGATGSLSITAAALSTNIPPAVRVDINDTRSPGQASQLTIVRNNPDGTQSPVRTFDGNPLQLSAGVGLVYDYEMALGSPVSYTALEVPSVASLQVTVTSSQAWLVHPGIPALSQPISLRPGTLQAETYVVKQGVFYPMGRANPVVVTDGSRKGASSQLVLLAQSPADLAALQSLFADATALLLNPSDATWQFGPAYIAVGDVRVSRFTDTVIDANRDVTLSFQVVDRPAGGSQSTRTWADVLAGYGSWSAVLATYRSWSDVLTGP